MGLLAVHHLALETTLQLGTGFQGVFMERVPKGCVVADAKRGSVSCCVRVASELKRGFFFLGHKGRVGLALELAAVLKEGVAEACTFRCCSLKALVNKTELSEEVVAGNVERGLV